MPRLASYGRRLLGVGLTTEMPFTGDPQLWTPTANTALIVDATSKAITYSNNTTLEKLEIYTGFLKPVKNQLFGEAAIDVSFGAPKFTGGNVIDFSNWPMLYTGIEWTIEFWFKYNGAVTDYTQSLCFAANSSNGRIMALFFDNTGKIRLLDPSSASTTTLEYDDGIIHHVVVQKNGTNLNCWIDGGDKVTRDISGYGANSSLIAKSLRFGNYLSGVPSGNSFYIDGIRVSNVAIYPNTTTIIIPSNPI